VKLALRFIAICICAAVVGAPNLFADTIDISANGGTYTFAGLTGSTFSSTNLGETGLSISQVTPVHGSPFSLPGSIQFSTGAYNGNGTFSAGGTISYMNVGLCGGSCLTGVTTGAAFSGANVLVNFTMNYVNPLFANAVGAHFDDSKPYNAYGSLSLTLASDPNADHVGQIGSGDYYLSQTPEPASLLLLGSGLLSIGGFWRRKLRMF
jgi:hypothetical protein